MKIVTKQIDKTTKSKDKYLVYLMDFNGRPLTCKIAYGEENKDILVGMLLNKYFTTTDLVGNKINKDSSKFIEEVTYEDYLKLKEEI